MSAQSEKKHIYKPKAISGFPEWLPEVRLVEQQWLDHIRKTFERYGFVSIETPAVEELEVLTAKGETDKEIYVLNRMQAEPEEETEARLGLHFDQTVPLARYTAQHFNNLSFPFKRYQMQKVWRGERPQLGRMREFLQCDIDVINVDHLPLYFDAEMPAIIFEVLSGLNIGRIQIRLSNRKILLGLLEDLGISDPLPITRTVDKLDKLGEMQIRSLLETENGLETSQINAILDLIQNQDLSTITPQGSTMKEGLEELRFVLDQLKFLPEGAVRADLSIIRGLDYYTGTVYETRLLDIPEFTSSVCSGGRYDDLAGAYINKHLPGVGISIGFSRLFDVLKHHGYIKTGPKCPTDVLVVLPSEEGRQLAQETARILRDKDINVELYHAPQKIGKQLSYAEKKGIRYVWFPPFDAEGAHEVKDMNSGEQTQADPDKWYIS
jgi:histidyl-tRNA synthetase